VYTDFRRWLNQEQGDSPVRFGDKLERSISVKSITYLPTNRDASGYTVQVRFVRNDILHGRAQAAQHKIAIINFDFFPMLLTTEEQFINPLGFQVISYRVDNEVQ
jgi:type IV secretion system protein VirB8